MYMTYEEFKNMVDNLVKDYDRECECILEFLNSEGIDRETVKKINPLYLVRMIHKSNMDYDIYIDEIKEFTYRFQILLGLCEMVEFVNRPTPKFKYKDIVREKCSKGMFFVMDYCKDGDYYCFDDVNGNGDANDREYFEEHFEKIGEVTEDVVNRIWNRNEEK